jgi:hypothetical protein
MRTVEVFVKIKIGKEKEVVLSEKEAEELYEKLQEVFGSPPIPYRIPWIPVEPWRERPWTQPYWVTYTTEDAGNTGGFVK